MKLKKILTLMCCAVLLVCISVGATLAYLTAEDTVTNTFTVGDVAITLDETDVNLDGVKDGDTRVDANKYKLMPGHTYTKDPIVHVDAESEDCYLFVKVENAISEIEDSASTIVAQMATNGWTLVTGQTNVYAHANIAKGGDDVNVFETFKIAGSVKDLSSYEDKTIVITAYAVQADGFTSSDAAWNAAVDNGDIQ